MGLNLISSQGKVPGGGSDPKEDTSSVFSFPFVHELTSKQVSGHGPMLAARAHTSRQPLPGGPILALTTVGSPWHHSVRMTWGHAQGEAGRQMVSVHCTVFMLTADISIVLCYSIHLCERSVL